MPNEILEMTTRFMHDAVRILVTKDELTLEGIRQFYIATDGEDYKLDALCDLYATLTITQAIIYANTRQEADSLAKSFKSRDFLVSTMHAEPDPSDGLVCFQLNLKTPKYSEKIWILKTEDSLERMECETSRFREPAYTSLHPTLCQLPLLDYDLNILHYFGMNLYTHEIKSENFYFHGDYEIDINSNTQIRKVRDSLCKTRKRVNANVQNARDSIQTTLAMSVYALAMKNFIIEARHCSVECMAYEACMESAYDVYTYVVDSNLNASPKLHVTALLGATHTAPSELNYFEQEAFLTIDVEDSLMFSVASFLLSVASLPIPIVVATALMATDVFFARFSTSTPALLEAYSLFVQYKAHKCVTEQTLYVQVVANAGD